MNTIRKIISAFKAPVPFIDRILELVALCILISMLVFTAYIYQQVPEQIPTKFDLDGNPVSMSDKVMLWYMSIFFVVMMLVSAGAAYDVNLKFVNVPFRIKGPVKTIQQKLISRMSRYVTICMGMMWLSFLLNTSVHFLSIPIFAAIFSKVSLFLMLAVIVYYSFKSWWIGRGC